MLKPGQVPDDAADAVLHCFHTRSAAKAALAAAINAWPGMSKTSYTDGYVVIERWLGLPLPKEAGDE